MSCFLIGIMRTNEFCDVVHNGVVGSRKIGGGGASQLARARQVVARSKKDPMKQKKHQTKDPMRLRQHNQKRDSSY